MSYITAHVLDAAAGIPAGGVDVRLETESGEHLASAVTDEDGRVGDLGPDLLEPGNYRVSFETGAYFASSQTETFFPLVTVQFTVVQGERHYHVPLLLSPYSYTTYRGS
jgi:5-hydroxyisourate hydrolase